MEQVELFDYYYGDESSQFSYYRIPRQLITGAAFKRLTTDAKLLYGLLLDRMGLSAKNGWYDAQGRVYIYYTLEEIQEDLNCGHDKATKLLVELDSKNGGIGLIQRVKQGQGKPAKIYVKRFTTRKIPQTSECGRPAPLTAENPQPRLRESRSPECGKSAANYPEENQNDLSQLYPSIPHSQNVGVTEMERWRLKKQIQENIGYHQLLERYGCDEVNDLLELIVDVLAGTASAIRISGESLSGETVRRRFYQLEQEHIAYVLDCMNQTTSKISNIRAYLLTALYHAPVTMNHYYAAAVRHDFGAK